MIEVVAFDLDDTLWRESDAQAHALAVLHHEWGVAAPLAAFGQVWREATGRLFDAFMDGRMTHAEQRRGRIHALLAAFGQDSGEASVDRWTERYVALYQEAWRAVPDAPQVLRRLSDMGLGLAVVTNGDGVQQRAKLERMGLGPWFPSVLISGEVGAAKPDPIIFRRLVVECGAPAASILFVGDRRDKDVEPARQMGMAALQIDHTGRQRGPDVVHSLAAVVEWLERGRAAAEVGGTTASAAD